MNEALDRFEEEKKMGLQPSANELDILDYLAFANGKVKYLMHRIFRISQFLYKCTFKQGNLNMAIELTKKILKLSIKLKRFLDTIHLKIELMYSSIFKT